MQSTSTNTNLVRVAIVLAVTLVAIANLFGQQGARAPNPQEAAQLAQHESNLQQLQQVLTNKAAYADAIAQRWESAAKASGKWDPNYATDMSNALQKLPADKLIAAGQATSYESMQAVLATGQPLAKPGPDLGTFYSDLVYTPITPCRLLDTRNVTSGGLAGPLAGGNSYLIDADNPSGFDGGAGANQGGSTTPGCGIPYDVAAAIAITITVISPANIGYLTAYGYTGPVPTAATMIYFPNPSILSTTTIDPITPGSGPDFNVYISQSMQLTIDVIGYFAENTATALNCTTASSAVTLVAVNVWTSVDAVCPAGFTVTGGGYDTTEGTQGYPGVWITTKPGPIDGSFNGWRTWVDNQASTARHIQTYAQCCQVPGR